MEEVNVSETELYNRLLEKLDRIKKNIESIRDYSEKKSIVNKNNYLKKLNVTSAHINTMYAYSSDMYDEFILNVDPEIINREELEERRNIIINKKIEQIFLPYMLYMQIILRNNDNS